MAPTDDDQAFFNCWDFVSMHTLKIELGISSEMAVHDQSFKVSHLSRHRQPTIAWSLERLQKVRTVNVFGNLD